ncbi:MAG: ribonuclease II [Candidatus Rokuibacteriota bacterium]|nr:MAG: ribonuclease II [Candidatus Rokubacteria bacterium]
MVERGLLPDFSATVMAEVNELARAAGDPEGALPDLRSRLWCSIDNDESRDLDQLSVAEEFDHETVKVLVAVADVDALVAKDSAIDDHARTNTTSVYTATEIFPMLPEKLSTDLTSLNEDEERLAIVIEMTVQADGSLGRSRVYRARVVNHAKLAYDSVAAWLEANGKAPARVATLPGLDEQLRLQDRIAQKLRALRHVHGALSLETVEPRAVFDGDVVTDFRMEERNRARDLIEDFMIAANGVMAGFLESRGRPSLRRILRSPERWERIVELAAGVDERLPAQPDAAALEAFLSRRRAADPLRFPDLSLSVVKLMGRGEYALQSPGQAASGHFGLAVGAYTHSTAPNRRFPDLISQRLLKAALAGLPAPYGLEDLEALARHCTEQEDQASRIERQIRKSAAALLLESRKGQHFDAIVTGASAKGTWVRVFHPPVEGRVVRGYSGLDVGDRVTVELVGTDVERGFIDFSTIRGR